MTQNQKKRPPALTADSRLNRLISLTYDQVEQELEEKRATSQTVQVFLKLATVQTELEIEEKKLQIELLREKINTEKSGNKLEDGVDKVVAALKMYRLGYIDEDE